MYRWQDPATAPVVAYRERKSVRNQVLCERLSGEAQKHWDRAKIAELVCQTPYGPAVPLIPSMTIDGVEYVEAPEKNDCEGCAFINADCIPIEDEAEDVFGGCCYERNVIYIRKA